MGVPCVTSSGIRILSWNMLRTNQEEDRAFRFVSESEWDVMCLQEVSRSFLDRLTRSPPHGAQIVCASDSTRAEPAGRVRTDYLVILSRHPLASMVSQPAPMPPARPFFPVALFSAAVAMCLHEVPAKLTKREFLYADVVMSENVTMRVFSVHLSLDTPGQRMLELNAILEHAGGRQSIVCGDFNVLDHPVLKTLNWLCGGSLSEARPWYPERRYMEERFKGTGLKNPLLGCTTHSIFGMRSQLDHILVPRPMRTEDACVFPERYGSDHFPIGLTVLL